jgi:hypothetical protein
MSQAMAGRQWINFSMIEIAVSVNSAVPSCVCLAQRWRASTCISWICSSWVSFCFASWLLQNCCSLMLLSHSDRLSCSAAERGNAHTDRQSAVAAMLEVPSDTTGGHMSIAHANQPQEGWPDLHAISTTTCGMQPPAPPAAAASGTPRPTPCLPASLSNSRSPGGPSQPAPLPAVSGPARPPPALWPLQPRRRAGQACGRWEQAGADALAGCLDRGIVLARIAASTDKPIGKLLQLAHAYNKSISIHSIPFPWQRYTRILGRNMNSQLSARASPRLSHLLLYSSSLESSEEISSPLPWAAARKARTSARASCKPCSAWSFSSLSCSRIATGWAVGTHQGSLA